MQGSTLDPWQIAFLAVLSFAVGLLGGTVGLALGTIRLPALLLMGVPAPVAGGTNILVSTISALAGGYHHLRERRVNWRLVAFIGIPSVVGAFIGGYMASVAPIALLILVAGGFSAWQGVEFLQMARRQANPGPHGTRQPQAVTLLTTQRRAVEGGLGFSVGLMGGAVGLILGSLRLPAMVRLLGINPRIAAGSNMVIGVSLGAFGFMGHGLRGELDLAALLAMGLTGAIGTYIGAHFTERVSLGTLLTMMGWILAVVGVILMGNGVLEWVR